MPKSIHRSHCALAHTLHEASYYYIVQHPIKREQKTKDIMILIKLQLQLKECNFQAHRNARERKESCIYMNVQVHAKSAHIQIKSEIVSDARCTSGKKINGLIM